MKQSEVKYTVILGPGNHQQKLIDAIKSCGFGFEVFNYYPFFKRTVFDADGNEIYSKENKIFSKLSQMLWATIVRIDFLNKKNYHTYFNYKLYDLWISNNFSKSSTQLWAWSQVSLRTMKAFSRKGATIILEKPMIHVDEWKKILDSEYNMFAPNQYQYYKISNLLTKQMKSEYELADSIVVLSDFALKTFKDNKVCQNKLVKVSLYADMVYPNNDYKILNNSTFNILFVGRIDILKGIPRLLKIIDRVIQKKPNIILTLVGEVKEEVEHLFDFERPYIKLVGVKSKKELTEFYSRADLLILPSVQESFGLVILEALSYGVKVLASKNTGAPDIAEYNKDITLFDPFDEADFEEKCLSLVNRKLDKMHNNFGVFSKQNYELQIKSILKNRC